MFSSLLTGMIGGLLGIGSNFLTSAYNAHEQYKYNKKLQEDQQDHQFDYFDYTFKKSNKYADVTSPSEKRKGLERAGYNPILALQSGNIHSAQSGSTAGGGYSGVSAHGTSIDFTDQIAQAQGFYNSAEQMNFIRENHAVDLATKEANLAQKEVDAAIKVEELAKLGAETTALGLENEYRNTEFYKYFRRYQDMNKAFPVQGKFSKEVEGLSSIFSRGLNSALSAYNKGGSRKPLVLKKRPSRSNFTNYRYKYHN